MAIFAVILCQAGRLSPANCGIARGRKCVEYIACAPFHAVPSILAAGVGLGYRKLIIAAGVALEVDPASFQMRFLRCSVRDVRACVLVC